MSILLSNHILGVVSFYPPLPVYVIAKW